MPFALAHHSSAFRLASSRVSASNTLSIGRLASAFLSVEIATSGFAFPPGVPMTRTINGEPPSGHHPRGTVVSAPVVAKVGNEFCGRRFHKTGDKWI